MPFVVMLSIIFLRREFSLAQYMSVALVIFGLAVVTLTDIFSSNSSAASDADANAANTSLVIAGFVCMVLGQVFHAS